MDRKIRVDRQVRHPAPVKPKKWLLWRLVKDGAVYDQIVFESDHRRIVRIVRWWLRLTTDREYKIRSSRT